MRKDGYKKISADVCFYCGLSAETWDHALPLSKVDHPFAVAKIMIPACRECNGILSNSLQETLGERAKEAKRRLKRKYAKILKMPLWTIDELMEMGEALRAQILAGNAAKELIERRIAFDYDKWANLGKPLNLLP